MKHGVRRFHHGLVGLGLFLSCGANCLAQVQVSAQIDNPHPQIGERFTLTVTVRGDVAQTSEPALPTMPFQVQAAGSSTSISMINGQTAASSTFSYVLTPLRPGGQIVPPIRVEAGGRVYQTEPLRVDVDGNQAAPPYSNQAPGTPSLPSSASSPGALPWGGPPEAVRPQGPPVFVEAEVSEHRPYVNQPVVYTFRLFHRVNLGQTHYEPPQATGFLREDLKQRTYQVERNGTNYSVSEARTVLFPTTAGSFTIGATRLTCQVLPETQPDDPFPDPFSLSDPVKELVTESMHLDVLPLPASGRPSDFSGGVGSFTLEAHFQKNRCKQGEPMTLLVTVEGDGHPDFLSDIAPPTSDEFKVYRAEAHSYTRKEDRFSGHRLYRIPVVPLKAGHLTFPSLHFSYFDPRLKRYQTLDSKPLVLDVEPEANPIAPPEPSASPGEANPGKSSLEPELRNAHTDTRLARAPGSGTAPWQDSSWFWLLQFLPWLGAFMTWLTRWLGGHWSRGAAERYHSGLCKRTRASLRRLSDGQSDRIASLLLTYLEEKTGQGWAGTSLGQFSRRLQELGASPEASDGLARLLTDLEALRYAPPGAASASGELMRKSADSLLEQLEKQLS